MKTYAVNWYTPSGKYDGEELDAEDMIDLINTIIALVQQKRVAKIEEIVELD